MLLSGIVATEGHIGNESVKKQYEYFKNLVESSGAKTVLEIGFNGGHSSELFLQTGCEVVSFDLGRHKYVAPAKAILDEAFPGKHTLILGDSKQTVPEYVAKNAGKVFDLIFVDGGHDFATASQDLANCKKASDARTIVVVDDVVDCEVIARGWCKGPGKAWQEAKAKGEVVETDAMTLTRGRGFVVGKFVHG